MTKEGKIQLQLCIVLGLKDRLQKKAQKSLSSFCWMLARPLLAAGTPVVVPDGIAVDREHFWPGIYSHLDRIKV